MTPTKTKATDPDPKKLAREVALQARRARTALDARDRAIRAAIASGASLRTVGAAAGLSFAGVRKIVNRPEVAR